MKEKFEKVIELFKERTGKDCYKIDLAEKNPAILDDKIGGKPYLPIGEEYPKDKDGNNLALTLQVNLKNIDLKGYPKKGIIEIFTDYKVDYPCQYAIKYFEEGLEYQVDLPEVDTSNYIIKEPYGINLTKTRCYMSINDYRFFEIFSSIVNEIYGIQLENHIDLYKYFGDFDWTEKLYNINENDSIVLGGYPDFTQEDPRYDMKENRDECLFKLDSWDNYDKFQIGDSGILFTLISQEDIENCNFENAIVDWDCS